MVSHNTTQRYVAYLILLCHAHLDAIWNLRERKWVFEPYEELSIQIQGSNLATVDRKQSLWARRRWNLTPLIARIIHKLDLLNGSHARIHLPRLLRDIPHRAGRWPHQPPIPIRPTQCPDHIQETSRRVARRPLRCRERETRTDGDIVRAGRLRLDRVLPVHAGQSR